jgi:hypothetical protein
MKLFEHPDFEQAILQAAEHFRAQGLRPAIIEKDYFVTEALRIVAAHGKVIFKGGTSLSKGWNLIQRFSEDIDIFLDPLGFEPFSTREGLTGNSRNSVMLYVPIRRLRCWRTQDEPLADSAGTIISLTRRGLADQAK